MKMCRECGQTKPTQEFHKNRRYKDGYGSLCKECGCKKSANYRQRLSEGVPMLPHAVNWEVRFWGRVEQTESCWVWLGGKAHFGHGLLYREGKTTHAHRISWELANGPIPDGLCVLHHCDNPACVNPDHLYLGTIVDNNHDRVVRGRGIMGEDHYLSKLTTDQVVIIRQAFEDGCSIANISREFCVTETTIREIVKHRTWKHIP